MGGVFLLAGAVHRLTGMGFALIVVPPLVALLGPHDGVTLGALGALLASVGVGLHARGDVDRRIARSLAVTVSIGSLLGLAISMLLPDVWLTIGVASAILASIALVIAARFRRGGVRPPRRPERAFVVAGIASGAMNSSSAIGGPALSVVASWSGMAHAVFVSTVQVPFVVMGIVGVGGRFVAFGVPQVDWWGWGALVAAIVIGLAVGAAARLVISERWAWIATLVVGAIGAISLLVGAMVG